MTALLLLGLAVVVVTGWLVVRRRRIDRASRAERQLADRRRRVDALERGRDGLAQVEALIASAEFELAPGVDRDTGLAAAYRKRDRLRARVADAERRLRVAPRPTSSVPLLEPFCRCPGCRRYAAHLAFLVGPAWRRQCVECGMLWSDPA